MGVDCWYSSRYSECSSSVTDPPDSSDEYLLLRLASPSTVALKGVWRCNEVWLGVGSESPSYWMGWKSLWCSHSLLLPTLRLQEAVWVASEELATPGLWSSCDPECYKDFSEHLGTRLSLTSSSGSVLGVARYLGSNHGMVCVPMISSSSYMVS